MSYIKQFDVFGDLWASEPEEAFEKFLEEEDAKMDKFAK